MSKPWLETWEGNSIDAISGYGEPMFILNAKTGYTGITVSVRAIGEIDPKPWALLACAAPDMCRALLAVEWSGLDAFFDDVISACPSCLCRTELKKHAESCILDAALTKAGLPTQESRDAARKELGL